MIRFSVGGGASILEGRDHLYTDAGRIVRLATGNTAGETTAWGTQRPVRLKPGPQTSEESCEMKRYMETNTDRVTHGVSRVLGGFDAPTREESAELTVEGLPSAAVTA